MPKAEQKQIDRLRLLADRAALVLMEYWSLKGTFDPFDREKPFASPEFNELREMTEYNEAIGIVRGWIQEGEK